MLENPQLDNNPFVTWDSSSEELEGRKKVNVLRKKKALQCSNTSSGLLADVYGSRTSTKKGMGQGRRPRTKKSYPISPSSSEISRNTTQLRFAKDSRPWSRNARQFVLVVIFLLTLSLFVFTQQAIMHVKLEQVENEIIALKKLVREKTNHFAPALPKTGNSEKNEDETLKQSETLRNISISLRNEPRLEKEITAEEDQPQKVGNDAILEMGNTKNYSTNQITNDYAEVCNEPQMNITKAEVGGILPWNLQEVITTFFEEINTSSSLMEKPEVNDTDLLIKVMDEIYDQLRSACLYQMVNTKKVHQIFQNSILPLLRQEMDQILTLSRLEPFRNDLDNHVNHSETFVGQSPEDSSDTTQEYDMDEKIMPQTQPIIQNNLTALIKINEDPPTTTSPLIWWLLELFYKIF